ncbi:MAG TPA: quinol:electron acceptor oxidoreductase subunit ActD [Anaerolineales bacterium]
MKNMIGGLFETQETANRAYESLQNSGFPSEEISMFIHKPRNRTARATNVRIQDIAKNAFIGGLIIAAMGGFIGFLVGTGKIILPGLEPGSVNFNPVFLFASIMAGIVAGGLTGIILGVASKLLRSREKAEVMTRKIKQEGVLVTVSVGDSQSEARARHVMEENEAIEVGNPAEKWDLNVWVSPNENSPSLANTR